MIRRCPDCQRVNPSEAAFCFFDGKPLRNLAASDTSSINFATAAFPRPFVYPSGAQCHNFMQLALACVRHPEETIKALRGGVLGTFFGGLGRIDLAMAAKSLAAMPDADRALDALLAKLPGSPLRPAVLNVEPLAANLGVVPMGEDREFVLTLTNKGDRLVHGKASVVDCSWLLLGDTGTPEKLFQFFEKTTIPVRIPGKRLAAFAKEKKAEIAIESSGGNVTVVVEIMVPVLPFPEGVLAGATSPRQLASLAKAHLKEAATLLEKGAVARWYEMNGWTYPVQGPTAKGIAAVQQFFEYLGLVKPPRVELSESAVTLQGGPGERINYTLKVMTQEKRAAFAHAVSDQPWLRIGKTSFRGQMATISLTVESVPGEPGQTLTAHAKVTANGNQRFDVVVTLRVTEPSLPAATREEAVAPLIPRFDQLSPAVSEDLDLNLFANLTAPAPREKRARKDAFPFADLTAPASKPPPPSRSAPAVALEAPTAPSPPAIPPLPAITPAEPVPALLSQEVAPARSSWMLLLTVSLLVGIVVIGLLTALVLQIPLRERADLPLPEVDWRNPVLDLHFHDSPRATDFISTPSMRFGLGIPDAKDRSHFKTRLIYDDMGRTCNVCVRIDKKIEYLFGIEQGAWKNPIKQPLGKDEDGNELIGAKSTWERSSSPKIVVTQYVEIVPEGLSADGTKRLLDTCLVRYDITNEDSVPHTVALRFLLDTFIGETDGVPFTIAGQKEWCDTMKSFHKPEDVPDYLAALENPDLKNPGTVAHLSLRYEDTLEPPGRVTLGAWPGAKVRKAANLAKDVASLAKLHNTRWEVPLAPMTIDGDSAVTMYWLDKELAPKATRTVGFAYGLGTVTGDKGSGELGITAGGEIVADKEFTLTAYVKNPAPGATVALTLTRGLTIATGSDKESVEPIPAGASSRFSTVHWRIKAIKSGVQRVKVSLNSGAVSEHRLVIKPSGISK